MKKFLCCLLLTCCASHNTELKLHDKLVHAVTIGDTEQAKSIVNNEKFYSDDKSKLLKTFEQTSILYLNSDYTEAALKAYSAEKLAQELYTKSISANIKSVFDDKEQIYYGKDYEISYVRLYHILSNYHLFLLSDKKDYKYLNVTKNSFKEWYGLLENFQTSKYNKTGYKYDILQGIFGGFLHEQYDDVENKNIALSLYKQVKQEINQENILYKIAPNNAKKSYVTPIYHKNQLNNFIDEKIKNLSNGKKDNTFFIIKEGLITSKQSKKYTFKLDLDNVIRLSYINNIFIENPNINKSLFLTFFLTNFMDNFEYEMPYIKQKTYKKMKIELINNKNEKLEIPLLLTSPMSDFAYQDISSNLEKEQSKLVRNLITKYITAGLSAYAIYNAAIENSKNDLLSNILALGLAVSTFKASQKLINESNKPDLRGWKTLPNSIFIASKELKRGTYKLNLYEIKNNKHLPIYTFCKNDCSTFNKQTLIYSKNITINDKHNLIDINI